jgi:hypothetical protein
MRDKKNNYSVGNDLESKPVCLLPWMDSFDCRFGGPGIESYLQ